jgi:hypothetical protein
MAKKKQTRGKSSTPPAWRTRIVGHGTERADQLLAHEQNWRVHPKAQQAAMRALIGSEIGWLQGALVNRRTSPTWPRQQRGVATMLDGHMRVQLALKQGDDTPVPVTYVDLTPREEKLALASFDRVSALAGTDDEQYDVLLADLADVSEDISAILVRERRPSKGLSHTVSPCTCCAKGCAPGCGCYREP